MNVILTYKITESESGRSIAAFLLDSGYSSRLVVHLRNTAESFFLNGKTVFSNTSSSRRTAWTSMLRRKRLLSRSFRFLRISLSSLKTNMSS